MSLSNGLRSVMIAFLSFISNLSFGFFSLIYRIFWTSCEFFLLINSTVAIRNWAKITFQNYSEEQESFFYNFKKLFLPNSLIRRKNRNLNQDLSDQREKPKTQVCIVLNFILIPLFSKEGAAIATLLSYIGLIYMSFIINKRLLPVHYEKTRLLKIV